MILRVDDDLDLGLIADSGQCFRWERVTDGTYRIVSGASCVYAEELGDRTFFLSCTEAEFAATWHSYLDLSEDYAAIRGRIDQESDPFLWSAAEHERGIRILRQDPWETLISFIASQNKSIPAIRRSVEALCRACGEPMEDVRGRGYRAFPTPEAVAALGEGELKACGLGYRWRYVRGAARAVATGELDLEELMRANLDDAIRVLTALDGVGPKVASCVALFGLHQLDAFPRDVWVRRILDNEYPGGYPFEDYSPYNGVCQQYMFAHYRSMTRPG